MVMGHVHVNGGVHVYVHLHVHVCEWCRAWCMGYVHMHVHGVHGVVQLMVTWCHGDMVSCMCMCVIVHGVHVCGAVDDAWCRACACV